MYGVCLIMDAKTMMKKIEQSLKNKNWGDEVEICPNEVRIKDEKTGECICMSRAVWDYLAQ